MPDTTFYQEYGKRPSAHTPAAAKYLGLSPATLETDRSTGKLGIPFIRIGRRIVYDLDVLDAWVAKRRVGG